MNIFKKLNSTTTNLNLIYLFSWIMLIYAFVRMIYVLPLDNPVRKYYTINYDRGEYMQIYDFNTPIINETQLNNYVRTIVGDMYNYDALNYFTHYNDVISRYFVKEAIKPFFDSIQARLDTVGENGLAVSGVPIAPMQIKNMGYLGDDFIFNVAIPMKITYSSKLGNYYETTLVELSLIRVPTTQFKTGLQILSFKEMPFSESSLFSY